MYVTIIEKLKCERLRKISIIYKEKKGTVQIHQIDCQKTPPTKTEERTPRQTPKGNPNTKNNTPEGQQKTKNDHHQANTCQNRKNKSKETTSEAVQKGGGRNPHPTP